MRLLYLSPQGAFCLTEDLDDDQVPRYAILSHTWGADGDEMTFDDIQNGKVKRGDKAGYAKLEFCAEQARKDKIDYFWVDTCCINKSSDSELSQAIRSMFRWYRGAVKCDVFLADVSSSKRDANCGSTTTWEKSFRSSRWFKRGWTLQELLGPATVEFFSRERKFLGSKVALVQEIHEVTGIPTAALHGKSVMDFSVEERFAWAEKRQTKKDEDMAYCLFGIFNVQLPVLYGEGRESAMRRLRREIGVTPSQIDKVIQESYNGKRLNIERLSGDSLPLECCFINLGITDHVRDIDKRSTIDGSGGETSYSLAARLEVELPPKSDQVSLNTLFEPRTRKDDSQLRPRRILIWGRAGMGKTTLCKKIVHDFYRSGLWNHLYDRVVWLSLRKLKRIASRNAVELLQNEFPCSWLGERIPEAFKKILEDERTLFLLDGLDEVSFALDQDSPGECVLHELMSRSHVIITSRPHSTRMLDHRLPDLEVETVGFFPMQIEEYLQQAAPKTNIDEIRSFVLKYPVIQSLAAIPIQLDAICCTWNKKEFPREHVTMTALYLTVSQTLWKNSILRLGKSHAGELITKQQLEHWSWRHIQTAIDAEIGFLQELGFHGLCAGVIEFSAEYIETLETSLPIPGHKIVHLLFLRASDNSVGADDRIFHFIHLTFQEFFAAQHFVSCWTSKKKLPYREETVFGKSSNPSARYVTPEDFVRLNKFVDRYNIFWRFVAGLLETKEDKLHLDRYLHLLDSEPIDLIGQMHQRLLIHCLNELRTANDELHCGFRRHEDRHLQWAVCKLRLGRAPRSFWEDEYSDYVLMRLLDDIEIEEAVLDVLRYQRSISQNILDAVISKLSEGTSEVVRDIAIQIVGEHCGSDQLVAVIHSSRMTSLELARAWKRSFRLLEPAVQILIGLLQNSDKRVHEKAVEALIEQEAFSNDTIDTLISLLHSFEKRIRISALHALGSKESLSKSVAEAVFNLLRDPDEDIRSEARSILKSREIVFSDEMINDCITRLQDSDRQAGFEAASALRTQRTYPSEAFGTLTTLLANPDVNVQFRATIALTGCTTLPEMVVEALAKVISDSDEESPVQIHAIRCLLRQTTLPSQMEKSFVELLLHPCSDVRIEVIRTCGKLTSVYNAVIESLVELLQDPNRNVRETAIDLLDEHFISFDPVSEGLANILLHEPEESVRRMAIDRCAEWVTLPDVVIESLATLLQDSDKCTRQDVAETFETRKIDGFPLPNIIADVLIKWLQNSDAYSRSQAVAVLGRQSFLSAAMVETLTGLLRDPWEGVRSEVIDALTGQAPLNSALVDAFAELLRDPNESLGVSNLYPILRHQEIQSFIPTLNLPALQRVVECWFEYGPVVCYIEGSCFCIRSRGKLRKIPLQQDQVEAFKARLYQARDNLGLPSLTSAWSA